MDPAKLQFNKLKMIHLRLTEAIKSKKKELYNYYNQNIVRLKLEQNFLKEQIDVELARLNKRKLPIETDLKSSVVDVKKENISTVKTISNENTEEKKKKEIAKTEKKQKKNNSATPAKTPITTPVDFGRLDLRVGKILNASKHPNADALYVETIDVGEEKPRNVVSGLVKFVPLEEMSNRMVVLLCNLKPSKIRGVLSEAMVMCASSPENVEILKPPPGAVPGDYVNVNGYTRSPDKVLKVFEEIAKDLKTDETLQATYKGIPWTVSDKGVVEAASLKNVQIK